MEAFSHRSLLDIEGLTRADVERILDTAEAFLQVSRRPVRKVPTLRGKTVINLFYEASTRTRTSFELAGKRLSADVINMSVSASSVNKGETLQDTCRTLEAMHPDVIVIRHSASGAASYVASKIACSVINAGDGMHSHPTQALLDAFTIRREKGTLDNLVVTIVGDIAHSRVARSNAHLLNLFGCEVRVVGPRTLLPVAVDSLGVRVFDRLEEALEGALRGVALSIGEGIRKSGIDMLLGEMEQAKALLDPRRAPAPSLAASTGKITGERTVVDVAPLTKVVECLFDLTGFVAGAAHFLRQLAFAVGAACQSGESESSGRRLRGFRAIGPRLVS